MTDGTQGITNFMGNTGSQATERGELQLLRLLGQGGRVFQEDQGTRIFFLTQAGKARHHLGVMGRGFNDIGSLFRTTFPTAELLEQYWRAVLQRGSARNGRHVQHIPGRFINESHLFIAVDDDDAGLHALDDMPGQFCHVGQIHPAFLRQGFAFPNALGQ